MPSTSLKLVSSRVPDGCRCLWAARGTVLDAVAFESLNVAVIHSDRKAHAQNPLGVFDHGPEVVVQIQGVGRDLKVLDRYVIGGFARRLFGCHMQDPL